MATKFGEHIPPFVKSICQTLQDANYTAYVVGGALRDIALNFTPKDYDVATSATPDEVENLFPHTVPTGKKFGTITVLVGDGELLEVTTYRLDADYSDGRRPDQVTYSSHILDDLARRDFTVNAIAYDPLSDELIDPYRGLEDAQKLLLRTVGDARERFSEDALRMMRAVRIKAEKGFTLAEELCNAIKAQNSMIKRISQERISAELCRIITSPRATEGVYDLLHLGLLAQVLPELANCAGVKQRADYHKFDVFGHITNTLQYAGTDLNVRLALLLHDIGKPHSISVDTRGVTHFYGHEIASVKLAEPILDRLKFSNQTKNQVLPLIRHHMRNVDSDKSLRQLMSILRTKEQAYRFAQIRYADKMAGRTPPADLSKNYHRTLERIDRILAEELPLQIHDLAVNGHDVQETLAIPPGPLVGQILEKLMQKVLTQPELNRTETLLHLLPQVYQEITS